MSAVANILRKSIITPFYRSHAGLLIFVFLVMFGTVESRYLVNYHETLILGMFNSTVFMLCVIIVWILYSLKILLYILSLLRKPEYVFLNSMILINKSKAFAQILIAVFSCFLPVIVYSIFIYSVGISQHYYVNSMGIFIFHVILCCINAYVILLFLRTQHKYSWTLVSLRLPNLGGRIGFYISHILSEEKIGLLISKGFSLALLYIVREASEPGDDFRILGLTWVFVLLAHTLLVLKVKTFEDQYLTWMRSLPINSVKTCLLYFAFYTAIMLPELLFSVTMIENAYEVLILALLSGGLLMFIHAYLFKPNRNPDRYSVLLFWLLIITFLIILSKLIIALIIALVLTASIRITNRYYKYESTID